MSLYYQDDYVTLYHGNCLTEHREWLDADVLVTDPPYGLQTLAGYYGLRKRDPDTGKRGAVGHVIAGDMSTGTRDSVLAAWGDMPRACFGTPRLPEPPGKWSDRLVWDKVEPGMNGGPFRYTHESIFIGGEGWKRAGTTSYSILRFAKSDGMGNEERSQHPHRKPVRLMEALLGAAPAGTIAEPFAGSGSTLVAAKNLGRKVIGVELDERYCEIIARRCAQDVLEFPA